MRATPTADETDLPNELDLAAIRAAIGRRRNWLVVATVAAFVLASLFVNVVTPRYTGESQVLLENQENFFTRPERTAAGSDATAQADPEAVASQVQLFTSRDLARQAIDRLQLAGNPEFDPLATGVGPVRRVLSLIGALPDPTRISPEDRILETFEQRLTVFSPSKTRVITIDFQSRDPDFAALGANVIADLYMEMQSNAKRQSASAAAASLSEQIAALRPKLAKANAEAEEFRISSGLLAGTNNMTLAGQQLAELNTQLSQARTAQADGQAKAALIRDMLREGRIGEVPDVANNELVRRIVEQRVTFRAQLALESRTLLPQHPRVKELTAQLNDLDAQLRAVALRTVRTLENDARLAGARVANLEAALDQQKRAAGTANIDDVRLRELQRTADAYKDQLDSSMAKYQEAIARENAQSTPADARIISRAVVPQLPSFPKKVPTILFATIATFVAALGVIVSAELLSGRPLLRRETLADAGEAPAPPAPRPAPVAPVDLPLPRQMMSVYDDPPPEPLPQTAPATAEEPAAAEDAAVSRLAPPVPPPSRPSTSSSLLARLREFAQSAAQSRAQPVPPAEPPRVEIAEPDPVEASTEPMHPSASDALAVVPLVAAEETLAEERLAEKRLAEAPVAEEPVVEELAAEEPATEGEDPAEHIRLHLQRGRGARVVATSLSGSDDAKERLIALGRRLARDGRTIVVDMDSGATDHLQARSGDGDGADLRGLSDLLAGTSSFAEVIHRDAESRLHFVPVGTEAVRDFRDFSLVLEALSETYDFLVLLMPALNASDVACDYAARVDYAVLAVDGATDSAASLAGRDLLTGAGAQEVMLIGWSKGTESQDVA